MEDHDSIEDGLQYDAVIVGAGIAGINTAHRLQQSLPNLRFMILEAREDIGGTWSIFQFPGVRSDSDLFTFGLPWKPWQGKAVGSGSAILSYIKEAADDENLLKYIKFQHRLLSANWSSKRATWSLKVQVKGEPETRVFETRFLLHCTGFIDHDKPLPASIPVIEHFKGSVVHPQFWPKNLDYSDKKVVVIGSGATAVTMVPALAKSAEHVTMLQWSPSYVIPMNGLDGIKSFVSKWFPPMAAHTIMKWVFLIETARNLAFCKLFPNAARQHMRAVTRKALPARVSCDEHFNPRYSPWEQRVCFCPDGDFFEPLGSGRASMKTDTIKQVSEHSITLNSGEVIEADVIVTATGMKMQLCGGADILIDGQRVDIGTKHLWQGQMIRDIPNLWIFFGFTAFSWTLGVDVTVRMFMKLVKDMQRQGHSAVVPRFDGSEDTSVEKPLFQLNSTYVRRTFDELPKTLQTAPWKARSFPFYDYWLLSFGAYRKGLQFS